MPITRGWANYFAIAEEQSIFGNLDGWIRRKIRGIQWRQWKKPKTRLKKLIALGIKENIAKNHAYSNKGPWRMANTYCMHKGLSNLKIESMGYIPMKTLVCVRS
jgi:RNA-directed DNA polymerase